MTPLSGTPGAPWPKMAQTKKMTSLSGCLRAAQQNRFLRDPERTVLYFHVIPFGNMMGKDDEKISQSQGPKLPN